VNEPSQARGGGEGGQFMEESTFLTSQKQLTNFFSPKVILQMSAVQIKTLKPCGDISGVISYVHIVNVSEQ